AFMEQTGIPTAAHAAFTDYDAARAYLRQHPAPVVVKASGLAAGKGVIVCETQEEAEAALRMIMVDRAFGAAGDVVVIEEFLQGPEVSVLAFSDGRTVKRMPPARDHKRIYEGDRGPNTGGMGAFAPPPDVDEALLDEIEATILRPAVQGMLERGTPYVGVLYAGLMLTQDGPKVLEFNCRFGDPETQAILLLLESDLLDVFEACLAGRLDETDVRWRDGAAATIVLASPGYPGAYPKGLPIEGVERAAAHENVVVFHAGTARDEAGRLVTAGGRVLNVSAYDADLERALRRAYAAVEEIAFEGMQYRRDIGKTVVEEQ
ncbi:MAG: phosphoribosylamine--glycine ligase, partial [Ardenticatenia bacterium]